MATPPWLRNVLVAVGQTGIKALRQGMREGASNALDSVLEDVQGFTEEIGRRVKKGRSTLRKKRPPAPRREPEAPEVIDATIEEEE